MHKGLAIKSVYGLIRALDRRALCYPTAHLDSLLYVRANGPCFLVLDQANPHAGSISRRQHEQLQVLISDA